MAVVSVAHLYSQVTLFKKNIIYLFLAALGLCYRAWAFPICGDRGLLCCSARTSRCSGHTGSLLPRLGFPHLWWPGAALVQCMDFSLQWLLLLWSTVSRVHGLSSCGAWVQLPWGMWDPPGPGVELVSCSLVGILPTTEPPGKSSRFLL